jgi:hypothetical protein
MQFLKLSQLFAAAFAVLLLSDCSTLVNAKQQRPSSGSSVPLRRSSSSAASGARASSANRGPVKRTKTVVVEDDTDYYEDQQEPLGDLFDDDNDEDADLNDSPRGRGPPPSRRQPPLSRTTPTPRNIAARQRNLPRSRYQETDEDDYATNDDYDDDENYNRPPRRGPPPRQARGRAAPLPAGRRRGPPPGRGAVVPYRQHGATGTFTRGLAALKSYAPDTEKLKRAALSSIQAARETTSGLSSNIYRDIKGLTSSELEQVMLKATRPDDAAVKGKHVERLVGVTYQISSNFDIYDAVLRKLWGKMAEKDWRTTIKALYILHRFSADGAPHHAAGLKARLRELRRTRDPKRKDSKYFNSKQLLAGDVSVETRKFRDFMARYAHFVLLRAQCFSGLFEEISTLPKVDKKKALIKPITATCLRTEHLEASAMLLKAGVACELKGGEECENTAIAAERVASDMIGLASAVAIALNRALKEDDLKGADPALLRKWCKFYKDELLPQTRSMVKRMSPKLDAYGLFLPSRMGTSVSRELLEKGLSLESSAATGKSAEKVIDEKADDVKEEEAIDADEEAKEILKPSVQKDVLKEKAVDVDAEFDDEYEYEDEEYYDDDDY